MNSFENQKKAIVDFIKERRVKYKISRRLLSIWSDVSYETIRRFERTGDISLDNLFRIAHELGWSVCSPNIFRKKPYATDPMLWHGIRSVRKWKRKKDN